MRRIICALFALAYTSVIAGDASAATVELPQDVIAGDASWLNINDIDYISGGYPLGTPGDTGLSFRDAHYGTETSGGFLRGAFLLQVQGAMYRDPDDEVDVTAGDDLTSLTSSAKLKGAKVTVRYDFLNDRPVARALFSFKNPSSRTLNIAVKAGTALDAGIGTVVTSTEDGDVDVENEDGWFVGTDEGERPVIGGMGDEPVDLVDAPDNDDEGTDNRWIQRFNLKIKPNKTKRVLLFIEVTDITTEAVLRLADAYDDSASLEASDLLIGLTETERKQVVNWDLPPPTV